MTERLSESEAVAQLLIDAGIATDPETDPEGVLPVHVGETFAEGTPHIGIHTPGQGTNEPRNHTGHMVSKPHLRIEVATATNRESFALGERLQAFCDSPAPRTATRDGRVAVINTLQRLSAVQQLGQHPKTKLYMAGVTVEVSVPSVTPDPEA